MIRPFTLVCMMSAFGAGLYLYQSKHQAQMLDREIGRTIKQTEETRNRTGMLRAEWALLNEPDRLAELAKAHTTLQTLKPTQFAALTDLAARLPAPVANNREKLPAEPEPEEAPAVPVAQAAPPVVTPAAPAKPREVTVAEVKPKPDVKVETKPESKPTAIAEAKAVVRHVEKPVVVARTETPAPAAAEPAPIRARAPHPQAEAASTDATAPGTVGAAVLRAMRAQNAGAAYAQSAPALAPVSAAPAYTPARSYAPTPYVQPSYAPPAYAQPAYAAPTASVLGGRSALPPPVPYAAR